MVPAGFLLNVCVVGFSESVEEVVDRVHELDTSGSAAP